MQLLILGTLIAITVSTAVHLLQIKEDQVN